MLIKILEDTKGADDGAVVRPYLKDGGIAGDGVYTVTDELAAALIGAGEAEEVSSRKAAKIAKADEKETIRIAQEAADKAAAEKEAADKAAAEKEAADKAAAEKEAADKAAAGSLIGMPPLSLPGA